MQFRLDVIRADRVISALAGTGTEGRARKAITTYRQIQTEDAKEAAMAAIGLLDPNKQTELKQLAR